MEIFTVWRDEEEDEDENGCRNKQQKKLCKSFRERNAVRYLW